MIFSKIGICLVMVQHCVPLLADIAMQKILNLISIQDQTIITKAPFSFDAPAIGQCSEVKTDSTSVTQGLTCLLSSTPRVGAMEVRDLKIDGPQCFPRP